MERNQVRGLQVPAAVTEALQEVRVPVERLGLVFPLRVLQEQVADFGGEERRRGGGLGARHEDVELLDGFGSVVLTFGELRLLAADFDVPPTIELTEPGFRFTHDKTSGSW